MSQTTSSDVSSSTKPPAIASTLGSMETVTESPTLIGDWHPTTPASAQKRLILVDLVLRAPTFLINVNASFGWTDRLWRPTRLSATSGFHTAHHLFEKTIIFADNAKQLISLISSHHCTFAAAICELDISLAASGSQRWFTEFSRRLQLVLSKISNFHRLATAGSRNTVIRPLEEDSPAREAMGRPRQLDDFMGLAFSKATHTIRCKVAYNIDTDAPLPSGGLPQPPSLFTCYGAQSKLQCCLLHKALGAPTIPGYHPFLLTETRSFLHRLIVLPSSYTRHIRRYAGGLALSVIHGYEVVRDGTADDALDAAASSSSRAGNDNSVPDAGFNAVGKPQPEVDDMLALTEECVGILSNKVASRLRAQLPGMGWKTDSA
ncbi:hypothetical protein D9619_010522 [Psilocybe cf. subviscida]|uniref:Uncharacterized protein n=1 Tax=Psilocybe cf. subviscida TaxID=2480587 RepID=A0A8H5AS21_9AGAR|nr:hypothetical protein D9619_010522 [Psilocybe cf. subviscida]